MISSIIDRVGSVLTGYGIHSSVRQHGGAKVNSLLDSTRAKNLASDVRITYHYKESGAKNNPIRVLMARLSQRGILKPFSPRDFNVDASDILALEETVTRAKVRYFRSVSKTPTSNSREVSRRTKMAELA